MAIVYLNATFLGAGSGTTSTARPPRVEIVRAGSQGGAVTLAIDTSKVTNSGWVRAAVTQFLQNLKIDGTIT